MRKVFLLMIICMVLIIPTVLGNKNNLGLEHVYVEDSILNNTVNQPWSPSSYFLNDGDWSTPAWGAGGGWSYYEEFFQKPTNWTSNPLRLIGANWTYGLANGLVYNQSINYSASINCLGFNDSGIWVRMRSNGFNGDAPVECKRAVGWWLIRSNGVTHPMESGVHWFYYNLSNVTFMKFNLTDGSGVGIINFSVNMTNGSENFWATTTTGNVYFNITTANYRIVATTVGGFPNPVNISFAGVKYANHTLVMGNSSGVNIYDCAVNGSKEILGVKVAHEDTPSAALIADIEISGESYYPNLTFIQNISLNVSGYANYTFCLDMTDPILVNLYLKYSTSAGFTHRYYLINQTLVSSSIKNITLHNFNYTAGLSEFRGEVRQLGDYSIYQGVITSLQRLYVSQGAVWKTVQMDESGEFGRIYFNIREADTDYRLRYLDRATNTIIKTTNSMKFLCDAGVCDVAIYLDPPTSTSAVTEVIVNITYNATSKVVYVEWDDITGLTNTADLLVTKETLGGTTSICSQTQAGTSGVFICPLGVYQGAILVRVFTSASPTLPSFTKWLSVNASQLSQLLEGQGLKNDGAWWVFGIAATATMAGFALSPLVGILSLVATVIIMSMLGILSILTMGFVIIVCVIGIFVGLKIK